MDDIYFNGEKVDLSTIENEMSMEKHPEDYQTVSLEDTLEIPVESIENTLTISTEDIHE